jgi:dTDP-4-dehydrorhamnose reductase
MRIVLFGASGRVGEELRGPLACAGELSTPSRAQLDLGDVLALRDFVAGVRPDVMVNASAVSDLDASEREPEMARRVNAEAVAMMGESARALGAALVHLSTDYVFDGRGERAYREDDPPNPLGVYAESKLAGERALAELGAPAIVLRTAWVFTMRRRCFVSQLVERARRERVIEVWPQTASPTFARDLAALVALLVRGLGARAGERAAEVAGVYHAGGSGAASRAEIARAIIELDPRRAEHVVEEVIELEAPPAGAAARPRYTALDCGKLERTFGLRLPPWRDGLARALEPRVV